MPEPFGEVNEGSWPGGGEVGKASLPDPVTGVWGAFGMRVLWGKNLRQDFGLKVGRL